MAYVYGLRPKDTNEYFYIGSTKNVLAHRLKQHLDYIRLGYNKNKHLVHKINQVGADNVVIEALIECDESERFNIEYAVISDYIKRGIPLTNIVVSADDYPLMRVKQEYDEFIPDLKHFHAILIASENGMPRIGDAMHDALAKEIEIASRQIVDLHLDAFTTDCNLLMATYR